MAKKKAKIWDAADYLDSPEMMSEYLNEALATGDLAVVMQAVGAIARAKGMREIAEQIGVSRESLYRSLDESGKPQFETVMKSLDAMGLQLQTTAKTAA